MEIRCAGCGTIAVMPDGWRGEKDVPDGWTLWGGIASPQPLVAAVGLPPDTAAADTAGITWSNVTAHLHLAAINGQSDVAAAPATAEIAWGKVAAMFAQIGWQMPDADYLLWVCSERCFAAAQQMISDVGSSGDGSRNGTLPAGTAPTLIAIDHDDYYAKHVGHTADGRQFLLTTPFLPNLRDYATGKGDEGQEFVALFLFDVGGNFLDAQIDAFGPRKKMDRQRRDEIYDNRLRDLGAVTFDRIQVRPFAVNRFGTTFGLLVREPEEDDESWWVELHPGNYMAFSEPWDSGVYDT
jgi:hypothetical protein